MDYLSLRKFGNFLKKTLGFDVFGHGKSWKNKQQQKLV